MHVLALQFGSGPKLNVVYPWPTLHPLTGFSVILLTDKQKNKQQEN